MRSQLIRPVGLVGRLENESADHIQGIAPVSLWVRPEPRRTSEIIAVPLLLVAIRPRRLPLGGGKDSRTGNSIAVP